MENLEIDSLSVMELLEVLEDLLDNAKTAPFSSKVLIDRDAMYEVLKDIRLFLPNELKQSRWVMDERNKILVDAQQEAELLKKDAEVRIEKLITEHEISKRAKQEAEQVIEEAHKMSRDLRIHAMEYVDGLLVDIAELFNKAYSEVKTQNSIIEQCYTEKIEEIFENRRELRETARG